MKILFALILISLTSTVALAESRVDAATFQFLKGDQADTSTPEPEPTKETSIDTEQESASDSGNSDSEYIGE